MTTAEFIYKVISLLLSNNNCFIYLSYDTNNNLTGMYPLNPAKERLTLGKQDLGGESLFLEMDFR